MIGFERTCNEPRFFGGVPAENGMGNIILREKGLNARVCPPRETGSDTPLHLSSRNLANQARSMTPFPFSLFGKE